MNIAQTQIETIQFVMPEHANPLGNLFGGKMMNWMTTAGTLAASRLARGPVVLGSMNDIDFLSPVRIGEVVWLSAQVEWTGHSSMEVCVHVESEAPATGQRRPTTRAHLAYVAIDEKGAPRLLPTHVTPEGEAEALLHAQAHARKEARLARMAEREARMREKDRLDSAKVTHAVESSRLVFPEQALSSGILFAGNLMMDIDEVGGILAHRYSRSVVVTAAIDAMDFFHPIRVGQVLILRAGLNLVGRTSMEIGVRVEGEDPRTGEHFHTCSAYLTFVALDEHGRPKSIPPFEPTSPDELRRKQAAEARRMLRRRRSPNP